MKVSRLAKEIGMQPNELFKELVHRGQKIVSPEYPIDSISAGAIKSMARGGGKIDFDNLFGPVRNEFKQLDSSSSDGTALNAYNRRDRAESDGETFEKDVGKLIYEKFPNSHLEGVFLFMADRLSLDSVNSNGDYGSGQFGYEIDHILHLKKGELHRLLLVECKCQQLKTEGRAKTSLHHQRWWVEYRGKRKDLKLQMWNQARAVLQLLKPLPETNLKIECISVFSDSDTDSLKDTMTVKDPRVSYATMSYGHFEQFLEEQSKDYVTLRITQSELLRRLRQGMPCKQLGHPDIRDAIEYHRRARLTLDFGLFRHFNLTSGKWAINGTAGMGKSVLLAYSLCVLSTDFVLSMNDVGELALDNFDSKSKGLPKLSDRKITVFSLKEKQKRIFEYYWNLLIQLYLEHDSKNEIQIIRPQIQLWEPGQELEGNVILIDEAHDLVPAAQEKIAGWVNKDPEKRYLIIACDRHQKLRMLEDDAQERMISGLNFSGCSKKLKRVYRNPFSVYTAGLALMFRWFAQKGAKVIPQANHLSEDFGYQVERRDVDSGLGCEFRMVEDAHPANRWHHCVSEFPDAVTAHGWLEQYKLGADDVLWVRFSKEDQHFDYEQLHKYQYHNLNTTESTSIIDKYIKGQEFPVVIVEGVGEHFNNDEMPDEMFLHRRELYLCASRASVFLFFIYNPEIVDETSAEVREEIAELVTTLQRPQRATTATQFWGLSFKVDNGYLPLSQFEDLVDPLEGGNAEDETVEVVKDDRDETDIDESENAEESVESGTDDGKETEEEPTVEEVSDPEVEVKPESSKPKVENSEAEKLFEEAPKKKKGFTILSHYTPTIIANYLDIKQFKVNKLLMDLEMFPESNKPMPLTVVELLCEHFGVPTPWSNTNTASDVPSIRLGTTIVNVGSLHKIIKNIHQKAEIKTNEIVVKLSELGIYEFPKNRNISGFELYAIFKELGLNVDLLQRYIQRK